MARASLCAAAVVALVAGAAACSAEDAYVPSGPVWAQIGTGVAGFESLSDDPGVALVPGVQGGLMIPLSLRAGGVVADAPTVTYRAYLADSDELVGTATRTVPLDPVDRDTVELVGTWLLFDLTVDRSVYVDRDVRIDLDLIDERGAHASDTAICRILPPAP